MSDIYLQITETPTVVTLSAPVISGALSSTVTVANTVTVALDSNSLSALENVTVTLGAAITGTVTVSNSVTISSLPAISGVVTANAGANFAGEIYNGIFNFSENAQMGVYVTSPIPTGTNSIGRVTVAGTVTIGAGTAQIGSVTASISGTVPISISSVTVGNSVTIGSLPAISGTVTANAFGKNVNSSTLQQIPIIGYDEDITAASDQIVVPVQISNNDGTIGSANPLPISGTVSLGIQQSDDADANIKFIPIGYATVDGGGQLDQWTAVDPLSPLPVYFPSNNPLPAGTNRIGVVTIGGGTVTIGAGTAQIGSVTASISNSVTIASFATSVTARLINPAGTTVTYAEVGTAGNPSIDVLSVQGVTSGTPINVYPMQGTTVSNTNFTSTTASTTLVSAVALRESLTVFNEGAGNLHISPGATCTTVAYQVRLSAGDYWECPQGQLSLLHSAVFATAGTARVCQVS